MYNKKLYLATYVVRLHHCPGPVTQFSEEELLMKESGNYLVFSTFNQLFIYVIILYAFYLQNFSVAKLAKEEIAPLVQKMEKEGKIDDGLLRKLFENGVSSLFIIVINKYNYY